MNKKVFTTKLENEQEVELAVLRPSPQSQVEAQLVYNVAWKKAELSGSILRRDLDSIAEKRGLWNEDKRKEVEGLERELLDLEKKLRSGATSFATKEDARDAALKMREIRNKRADLLRAKLDLDSFTCENFADLARTNHIIASCTVYNSDGKRFFKDYDDFISQSNNEVAVKAAVSYFELAMSDSRSDVYEEEFLKKYKYVNEKGHLIDYRGRLISFEGRLVNEDGKYIDENGQFIDIEGNSVDKDGNYTIEFKEWE